MRPGTRSPGLTAGRAGPVTLELMDRYTIRAVDDVHRLGLDRDAAAMLLVESDLPGGGGGRGARCGRARLRGGGRDDGDAGRRTPRRPTGCGRGGGSRSAPWSTRAWRGWRTSACRAAGCPRCWSRSRRSPFATASACGTFGHAGDGNLHPTFILDRDEGDAAVVRLDAARAELYEAALALGGTVTGEHGIGAARRDWLVRQRGEDAVAVMRAIKHALDPRGLLNPGRML